jgi:hypothetical protein
MAEVHHERAFTLKHEFRVGQIVELKPSVTRRAAAGQYEITHLLPEPNVSSASPSDRIKSSAEIYQRIVPESDLALSTGPTEGASSDHVTTGLLAAPRLGLLTMRDCRKP